MILNKRSYFSQILILNLIILLMLSGCGEKSNKVDSNGNLEKTDADFLTEIMTDNPAVDAFEKSKSEEITFKNRVENPTGVISFENDVPVISGDGIKIDQNDIVITNAGNYEITGKTSNARIVVNAGSLKVNLILNGADISCNYSSAIFIKSSGFATVTAYDNSVNRLVDATNYAFSDNYSIISDQAPDACIYSQNNMLLTGSGKLIVTANFKNGITSKDALDVEKANISLSSVGHGITGKSRLNIIDSSFNIVSESDGLRSNSTANSSEGTVNITNCNGNISSGEDSIQAETTLTVDSGEYSVISGGGSGVMSDSEISAKALKGGTKILINDGTFRLNSLDDAIHSNGNIEISGGSFSLESGDDGIHADDDITLLGGVIAINKSEEGIEATNITLSGASVKIVSTDDGVNISGGDGSTEQGGFGMDRFGSSGGTLLISAGMLWVNAEGDAIDVNGDITLSGGSVILNGPTRGGNGVVDFDKTFTISGGTLFAIGNSHMAQTPSEDSTQNMLVYTDFSGKEGDVLNIQTASGDELISYSAIKDFTWVCYSSSKIKTGESYTAFVGGSHSGEAKNGVYQSGSYKNGEKIDTLIVDSIITSNGSSNSGGFGGGHDNNPPFKNPTEGDKSKRPSNGIPEDDGRRPFDFE